MQSGQTTYFLPNYCTSCNKECETVVLGRRLHATKSAWQLFNPDDQPQITIFLAPQLL